MTRKHSITIVLSFLSLTSITENGFATDNIPADRSKSLPIDGRANSFAAHTSAIGQKHEIKSHGGVTLESWWNGLGEFQKRYQINSRNVFWGKLRTYAPEVYEKLLQKAEQQYPGWTPLPIPGWFKDLTTEVQGHLFVKHNEILPLLYDLTDEDRKAFIQPIIAYTSSQRPDDPINAAYIERLNQMPKSPIKAVTSMHGGIVKSRGGMTLESWWEGLDEFQKRYQINTRNVFWGKLRTYAPEVYKKLLQKAEQQYPGLDPLPIPGWFKDLTTEVQGHLFVKHNEILPLLYDLTDEARSVFIQPIIAYTSSRYPDDPINVKYIEQLKRAVEQLKQVPKSPIKAAPPAQQTRNSVNRNPIAGATQSDYADVEVIPDSEGEEDIPGSEDEADIDEKAIRLLLSLSK